MDKADQPTREEVDRLKQELKELRYDHDSLRRSYHAMIKLNHCYRDWCDELERGYGVVRLVQERDMYKRLFRNAKQRLADAIDHFGLDYTPVAHEEIDPVVRHAPPILPCPSCGRRLGWRLSRARGQRWRRRQITN